MRVHRTGKKEPHLITKVLAASDGAVFVLSYGGEPVSLRVRSLATDLGPKYAARSSGRRASSSGRGCQPGARKAVALVRARFGLRASR